MIAARLDLAASPRVEVEAPDGSRHAPVMDQEWCNAPFLGPACFVMPIVLPKTARVTGGQARMSGYGRPRMRLNKVRIACQRNNDYALPAEAFAKGKDYEIPGLGFADFVRHELRIQPNLQAGERAGILLQVHVEYLLPAPTAAAYLTYIMTQA